jgi:hypothetical protein
MSCDQYQYPRKIISAAIQPTLDGKTQSEVGGAPVIVHPPEAAPPEPLARLQHTAVVCLTAARVAVPPPMGQRSKHTAPLRTEML